MTVHVLRALDRTWRTAAQVLLGYLGIAQTLGGVDWTTAGSAAGAAAVVALLQGLSDLPTAPGGGVGDVLGRALRTFAQAGAASIGAATFLTDIHLGTMLGASALAALASVITSVLTMGVGPKGTPDLVAAPAGHAVHR